MGVGVLSHRGNDRRTVGGAHKISHAGYIPRLILDAVANDGGVEEGGFELQLQVGSLRVVDIESPREVVQLGDDDPAVVGGG